MKKPILVISILSLSSVIFFACPKINQSKQPIKKINKNHTLIINIKNNKSETFIRTATQDEIGRTVICPVMGTIFIVTATTKVAEYKNQKVFLCCPSCIDEFQQNPDKYLN